MAKELNLQDRVSAYLRDELTTQERLNFESDLKTDSKVAEELAFQESLNKAIESTRSEELKASFIALENSLVGKENEEGSNAKTPKRKLLIGGIILLLLASALLFYLFSGTGKSLDEHKMYAENYATYPNTLLDIERGENTNQINDLVEIMQLYDKGQYQDVLKNITSYQGEKEQELKFYQAISLMELKKYESAIEIFENLEKTKLSNFQSAIYWYSALAYLKLEKHSKSIAQLEKLIVASDKYQNTKARALLERLK